MHVQTNGLLYLIPSLIPSLTPSLIPIDPLGPINP